ncbi:MAG: DUF4760 domain-containing protein [Pseudomonadota bacterium]
MLTQEGVQIAVCTPSGGFWWLTPLILSCSAITAAYLSVQSIRTNRDMARKKATLDLIVQTESTDYYQSLYRTFTDIRKDESGFAQIFSPSNPEIVKQRQMVLNYLNHYEIIAMGIADGILDEIVYKDYMRSTVVRDWFAAEPFIRHIREPSADSGSEVSASAAFSNFEALALKWEPEVKRSL